MKEIPILYNDKSECCGCAICVALCPKSAITMVADYEGFQYPEINSQKCVRCGKCLNICIFKHNMKGRT